MGCGTYLQIDVGRGDSQRAKERIGERIIVVLAAMDDDLLDTRSYRGAVNGSELRKVGSRPN